MSKMIASDTPVALEPTIYKIRGERVVLDSDLAAIYGVPTKRFNEAFKRNRNRFPEDFAFGLTAAEHATLRSQYATSNNRTDRGGRRYAPWGVH